MYIARLHLPHSMMKQSQSLFQFSLVHITYTIRIVARETSTFSAILVRLVCPEFQKFISKKMLDKAIVVTNLLDETVSIILFFGTKVPIAK